MLLAWLKSLSLELCGGGPKQRAYKCVTSSKTQRCQTWLQEASRTASIKTSRSNVYESSKQGTIDEADDCDPGNESRRKLQSVSTEKS